MTASSANWPILRPVLVADHAASIARAITGWDQRSGPLYLALADAIAEALASGRIPAHLPSERALAAALHVGRGTVTSAYEVLRERQLLDRQRGSGTVGTRRAHAVCADPLACVQEFFTR